MNTSELTKKINALPEKARQEVEDYINLLQGKYGKEKGRSKEKVANYKELPIQWAKSTPSIDDFAGIWKDRDITLSQIRARGWERN